jgi:hypothetical protein
VRTLIAAAAILLAGCRGEPVPRDYQNAPPDMTKPASSKQETPAAHGLGDAPPQPSTGVEGTTTAPVTPPGATETTVSDTPPVTTTT